ncbi:MAG TPA: hypothetical protein VGI63_02080 [Verrucomicrobiae bacterium]|jgi:hypothetical protein
MKIEDYIKKHELTLWRTWPEYDTKSSMTLSFFVTREVVGKTERFPNGDKIEIYSNPELTRFVAMNVTQGLFRVVHHELITIASEWQPSHLNFNLPGIF